jgi:hypothetical protein
MFKKKEDKGGYIQLLFPITKPHDWLERGVEVGNRKIGLICD